MLKECAIYVQDDGLPKWNPALLIPCRFPEANESTGL